MYKQIELLAPGGDIDSIKAAIIAGADAVYCGLNKFNARNRAENIIFDDLNGILNLAHKHHCEVFLTLNILIVDCEITDLVHFLNRLLNTCIDGIIVQDIGLLYLLGKYFNSFKIHASTQLTTHNAGQILFLKKLNISRVNLSRELNLFEIKNLTEVAHANNMLTEIFVHGSSCISFSGLCYFSSAQGGNSGNRGRCSQPCRDSYETTSVGKKFPLNVKDNSAFFDLVEIADAGVDAIKIEGRIKKYHYVYIVVEAWRKQLQRFYASNKISNDNGALYSVFNRDFSNSFLKGEINKDMFIDNPRDNSAIHLSEINGSISAENLEKAKGDIYDERTDIIKSVEAKIATLSIAKIPLKIVISGKCGNTLKIFVQTPDTSFVLESELVLSANGAQILTYELILKRLKTINDSAYFIEYLDVENLQPDLYIPFKELSQIKKQLWYLLNDSKEFLDPVVIPKLKKNSQEQFNSSLSILISSQSNFYLSSATSATVYFQLPECMKKTCSELTDFFTKNKQVIPWFPSVLIGEDYSAALEFLEKVKPQLIVTNNTGIANEACNNGIHWIAGPFMNIVNSYSLICLKETINCTGAFISNEISKNQIKGIKKPDGFKLFYSIYHPIELMVSRQCLFHQITGCEKNKIDEACIDLCEKSASINNLKNSTFNVEKSKGNYHKIYNGLNALNTDIVNDVPNLFSEFLIDLRDIKTQTNVQTNKSKLIVLFENFLAGKQNAATELHQVIQFTTNAQYINGI